MARTGRTGRTAGATQAPRKARSVRAARAVRVLTGAAGAGVISYGIYGLLHDPYIGDPLSVLFWGVGGLVLHDGLWLPLVLLAGTALVRRPLLRAGLVVAAALTAVGLPAVLRAGVDHGNASLLPLPYLRNLLLSLAAVAVVVGAIAVGRAVAPRVPPALGRLRRARQAVRVRRTSRGARRSPARPG